MPLTNERLAEALAIQKLHGVKGPDWIASRIEALATAQDWPGVTRFQQIAAEYQTLLTSTRQ